MFKQKQSSTFEFFPIAFLPSILILLKLHMTFPQEITVASHMKRTQMFI